MDNKNMTSTAPPKKQPKRISNALLAVIASAAVLLILGTVLLVVLLPTAESRSDDPELSGVVDPARLNEELAKFKGNWRVDQITTMEFDGKGNGVMHAGKELTFTYTIENNKMVLKFDSEKSSDGYYNYVLSGDNLTLSRDVDGKEWKLKKISN